MFNYGKIYSQLKTSDLRKMKIGITWNDYSAVAAKLYMTLFGYPDIASQMRYRLVTKELEFKPGMTLLDAGSGNGIYVHEYTKSFGIKGFGIDGRKERVKQAEMINKSLGFSSEFKTLLLEDLPLKGKKFDRIICLEVLEHIVDDQAVLKNLGKNLNPGGRMVITIPKKGTALDHEHEEDPDFEPEEFEHVRSGYEVSDLKKLCKNAGFTKVRIEPYFYFFSRYTTKLQQVLYKRKLVVLNLLLSPVFTALALLDDYVKIAPRGYLVIIRK